MSVVTRWRRTFSSSTTQLRWMPGCCFSNTGESFCISIICTLLTVAIVSVVSARAGTASSTPSDAPTDTPADARTNAPTDALADALADARTDMPTGTPTGTPASRSAAAPCLFRPMLVPPCNGQLSQLPPSTL